METSEILGLCQRIVKLVKVFI